MAKGKTKKRRSYSKKFTLPLLALSGFVPLTIGTIQHGMWNGWTGQGDTALDYFTRSLTGFSPNRAGYGSATFSFSNMKVGLLPIAIGLLGHKVASKLGINRMLAQANVPFIRL